ncbi:MAG: hypothetical protein QXW40_08365, partial [Thermofilum sp.]
MGGFTTAISVTSPTEIWEYVNRTLTSYAGLIERIPPTYSKDPVVVYRGRRLYPELTELNLLYTGLAGGIYLPENDLLRNAVRTVLDPNLVNVENLHDYDDTTWSSAPGSSFTGPGERDLIMYDLGSEQTGFIYVNCYVATSVTGIRVYTSLDGSTWNVGLELIGCKGLPNTKYLSLTRYIKISAYTPEPTGFPLDDTNFRLYSLEFYPFPGATSLVLPHGDFLITILAENATYQVLERYI